MGIILDETRAPTATRGPRLSPVSRAWPALLAWCVVVLSARVVVVDLVRSGAHLRIPFPPLDAALDWRPGWPVLLPVGVAILVVGLAPRAIAAWSWTRVVVGSGLAAAAWGVSLALLDGVDGLVGSVTLKNEYFLDVGRVGDVLTFVRGFTTHLAEYRIHVQGHPPGYLLLLTALDRLGLGTPGVVAAVEIGGGALAVVAVLVTVRDVAGEDVARRAGPFLVVAPAAIWIVSSADAFYAGVGAWAVALVVLATRRGAARSTVLALSGGLLFGAVAFLSYGLVLLAAIPLVVALHRRRLAPLLLAGVGAVAVAGVFLLAGFSWFDGLAATHARYVAGVASRRPYWPFLLANAACLAIVLGPALGVAIVRLRDRRLWLLVGAAFGAIAVAAASGMSKGEVERIWLPFAVWVLPAGAVLVKDRRAPWWLGLQAATAIFVQTLVRSPW